MKHHRKLSQTIAKRANQQFDLFINHPDSMGCDVLTDGFRERFLSSSIQSIKSNTLKNIFIDIGTNIGPIRVKVGNKFGDLIAVKPCSIVFRVIQANALSHVAASKFSLRNHCLGENEELMQVAIPRGNPGGESVRGMRNQLTEYEFARREDEQLVANQIVKVSLISANTFFNGPASWVRFMVRNIMVTIGIWGMEDPSLDALLKSRLSPLQKTICFVGTWFSKLNTQTINSADGNLLFQPKNISRWMILSELDSIEDATELYIRNPEPVTEMFSRYA